jgi:hypothetical protein
LTRRVEAPLSHEVKVTALVFHLFGTGRVSRR